MSIFELQTSLFTTLADPYIAPMRRFKKCQPRSGEWLALTVNLGDILSASWASKSSKWAWQILTGWTRWQGVVCPVCPSRSTALRSDFSHHPAIVLGAEPMGRRGANQKSRSDRRHPTGWERMIRWLDDLKGHVSSSKEWTILNSVLCSVHLSTTLWFGKWCH